MRRTGRPGRVRRNAGNGRHPDALPASVNALAKRYRGSRHAALRGVDAAVAAGEVHALVGESGSGKTTFLRLVAGLEVPDAGVVRIGDRTVAGPGEWVPPERRGVGMVFQDFALFPHMTVRRNVAFGLRSLPSAERRDRADELLERVGLAGVGGRHPHQLSGGQKQRVALARALAPEPRLLLLDEPFSNLDVPLKVELREEIGTLLRRSGVTAILVVHEMDDVFHLADRVTVLRDGEVVQAGTPEAVYTEPSCAYVARLFGETNLLPGRPVDEGLKTPLGVVACPGGIPWRAEAEADGGGEAAGHLMVRPEDIVLAADSPDGPVAVVRDVRRRARSDRVRLVLETEDGGRRHRVFADAKELPDGIQVGSRVRITVRPGSFRILPPDPVPRD